MNDLHHLMADWREAYERANRKPAPPIRYYAGWFIIDLEGHVSHHRKSALAQMTNRLNRVSVGKNSA